MTNRKVDRRTSERMKAEQGLYSELPEMILVASAAAILNCSRTYIRSNLIANGKVHWREIAGAKRVNRDEILEIVGKKV